MMSGNWLDDIACLERYEDLVHEAERARLASQARKGQKRDRRFSWALIWLGRRLVVWGRRLEERYGAEPQPLCSAP